MANERRNLKGIKGQYEFVALLRADDLAHRSLAINHKAQGDARFVVIRESKPEVMEEKAQLAQLLKELRVTSRFRHAGLERTIETGKTKSSYFAITEFLLGDGLGRILSQARRLGKRLPPALAAGLIAQVAHGLAHAHQVKDSRGKPLEALHHHVHPNSIVLLYHGAVKLVDFDIRRRAFRIEAGVPKGEVAYSSPERNLQEKLGPATDVFSLGVVLWELLAERRLFHRRSQVDTLRAIKAGEVPPIDRADPPPKALVDVARRALETDPTKRWAGATEMATALEAAVEELGEAAGEFELGGFVRSVMGDREKKKRELLQTCLERDLEDGELSRLTLDLRSPVIWLPQPGNKTAVLAPPGEDEPSEEPKPAEESASDAKLGPELLPRTELIDRPVGADAQGKDQAEDEQPATRASAAEIKAPEGAEDPVATGRAEPAEPVTVPSLPPKPPATTSSLDPPEAPAKDPTPPPPTSEADSEAGDDEEIEYIEEKLQPAPPEFQPSQPPPADDGAEETAAALMGTPGETDQDEPQEDEKPGPSIRISMPGKAGKASKSKLPMVLGIGGVAVLGAVLTVVFWPTGTPQPAASDAGVSVPVSPDAGTAPARADAPAPADVPPPKDAPKDPPAGPPDPGPSDTVGGGEPVEAASLEVRSDPAGCPVWLNGKRLDEVTPLTGIQLEPNRAHRVAINCAGHGSVKKRIEPKPGEPVTLDITPSRITQGSLDLNSIPWTQVYKGKRKLGVTPLLGFKLPAGKHQLRMINEAAGIDKRITVTIRAGKKTSLLKKLKP